MRPRHVPFEMRFEGLPGEFTQHDFGEVDVSFDDGSTKRIHFFASRLKFSRWAEVSIVPDQKAETLVRAAIDHTTLGSNGPVTLRLTLQFDSPVGTFQQTVVRQVSAAGVAGTTQD